VAVTPTTLDQARRALDRLDRALLALLNRRMRLSADVARIKRRERLPALAPEREEQLLRNLVRRNPGPVTDPALRAIYREILSASRAVGSTERVACAGPAGANAHAAAQARFGSNPEIVPGFSIEDVFYEVDRRKADYGVVPVESTAEGVVNRTLDQFVDSEVKICAETLLGDVRGNARARLLVLAKAWSRRTGRDKTSLMVSGQDRVGALHDMLRPFDRNGINLTTIKSRPSRRRPWEYWFFLDIEGHVDDARVARALAQLKPVSTSIKILGSYPAASVTVAS
jgi:prephenate dehydratase